RRIHCRPNPTERHYVRGSLMRLAKYQHPAGTVGVGILDGDRLRSLDLARAGTATLADLLAAPDPAALASRSLGAEALPLAAVALLPPVDAQEVCDAGVGAAAARAGRHPAADRARRGRRVRGGHVTGADGPAAGGVGGLAGPGERVPEWRHPADRHRRRTAGRFHSARWRHSDDRDR